MRKIKTYLPLFLIPTLTACFPVSEEAYLPTVTEGRTYQTRCGVVGPNSGVEFQFDTVKVQVQQGGTLVELLVPAEKVAQFESEVGILSSPASPLPIQLKAMGTTVYLPGAKTSTKVKTLAPMAGGVDSKTIRYLRYSTRFGTEQKLPDEFDLTLPSVKINEVLFPIPKIHYKRQRITSMMPINC